MTNSEENLLWHELSREKVKDCVIFDYWKVNRKNIAGNEASFALIDAPNWVTIVAPISNNGQPSFLMVKQFRHGSASLTMEFPAGTVDRGEEPLSAAKRELMEETGYEAKEWVELGAINPNPAFMANTSYTYLALGLKKVGELNLDPLESLDPYIVPEEEVQSQMGSGLYDNGIMVTALALYNRYKSEQNFSID